MELLDLVNVDGNSLGRTIARGDKSFKEGEYIKIVVVYLISNGKYLFQLTSEEKGREYAVTGGHVPTGFTTKEQAVVECEEELGIKLDDSKLEYLGNYPRGRALFYVYQYLDDSLDKVEMTLQDEEVESVQWLTKKEIEDLINKDLVRPSTCKSYSMFIK
ncbi:MAG: NUDIX domain-containing protein [Erysipelotrichaceae bacterium]|nr:NUDIX domain-containing protein [Erysipelotrichaceae bacterium]